MLVLSAGPVATLVGVLFGTQRYGMGMVRMSELTE